MSTTAKPLTTWDSAKQARYREKNADTCLVFHFAIDASGSMDDYAVALRESYGLYVAWLKKECGPMSLGQQMLFNHEAPPAPVMALASLPPLTTQTYRPEGGTALYDCLGAIATQHPEPGQHILVVFSDGVDLHSATWTADTCKEALATLQAEAGWLVVFLAAYAEGLETAATLGVSPGNALIFPGTAIPEVFEHLKKATQRYLGAPAAVRKALAAGGLFHAT